MFQEVDRVILKDRWKQKIHMEATFIEKQWIPQAIKQNKQVNKTDQRTTNLTGLNFLASYVRIQWHYMFQRLGRKQL